MSKTTERPWVANHQHQGVGWRVESDATGYPNDGWVICSDMLGPDAEANARLIAASPDLLTALQFAVDHLTADTFTGDELGDFFEMARAAIAKATASQSGQPQ